MTLSFIRVGAVACASLVLGACQLKSPQLLRDATKPVEQPIELNPANYQSQKSQIQQDNILIIFFEENKKQNVLNAIKNKGDHIIYDYQVFNSVAIGINNQQDLKVSIDFYQNIDGVLQVNKNEISQLN